MGLVLFTVQPNRIVFAPPRCACAKCGEPLGYRWSEQTRPAADAYCATCHWLLCDKSANISVFFNAQRPAASVVRALGLPLDWNERQLAEPVPSAEVAVEKWPELSPVPAVDRVLPLHELFESLN